ncbi:modulator of macroautophagy TMEM150B-like isoform X1 [Alosa sapidissima]|uniref:modulator of macroautophagy TMEM150B-like isoform X1 n=1 Tax=Alosa sapidissima TaxID=34773 RepID=UPI001C097544|nr:modulator of macroautophagy TMEM150B-like isoform X1 [Alosa sapidissima]XP_041943120.1 modulator of macroautophagy TMEM150B-like isoform X1 [Alosa sapidissima]XP_041943121.1 modulator of macroautophagy TMEM150B-like isoform X1 [Alosa sapidissima]
MWAWALLPVILAVGGTAGIWAVYGVAVSNESVNLTAGFPYISTCGSYYPQSCWFSQICNVSSFLIIWIVVIRYQQVRDLGYQCRRTNLAALVLGFISSIGISILGNFQQSVSLGIHLFGAFLAFIVGLVYFWVQLWLTYKAEPSQDRHWLGPLRAVLCSLCTVFLIATMCEWALVMTFFLLFASFAAEFRLIECHQLTVHKQMREKITRSWLMAMNPEG